MQQQAKKLLGFVVRLKKILLSSESFSISREHSVFKLLIYSTYSNNYLDYMMITQLSTVKFINTVIIENHGNLVCDEDKKEKSSCKEQQAKGLDPGLLKVAGFSQIIYQKNWFCFHSTFRKRN